MPQLDSELSEEAKTVEADLEGINDKSDDGDTIAGGELEADKEETTSEEDSTTEDETDKGTTDDDGKEVKKDDPAYFQTAYQKAMARLKTLDPSVAEEVRADVKASTGKETSSEQATTEKEKTFGEMTKTEVGEYLDGRMADQKQQNAVVQERNFAMETITAFAQEAKIDGETLKKVAEQTRKDHNVDMTKPGQSSMLAEMVISRLRDHVQTQGKQTTTDTAAADAADAARTAALTAQPGKTASPAPVKKSRAQSVLEGIFNAGPESSLSKLDSFQKKKTG